MKLAMAVEYDGSGFHGWQRQGSTRTVQCVLEAALSRVADQPVQLVCAGRTDAGVHATAQVVHFESSARRAAHAWLFGTNSNLPRDAAVLWLREVPADFHARYSATRRRYRYVMLNRRLRSGLWRRRAAWVCEPLDAARMQAAGQCLVGEHDFSAFRAAGCQARSPVREVYELSVTRAGDFVYLDIAANAFLHNMVRIVAGSLIAVGRGERPARWIEQLRACGDRRAAGATAPAAGLYLVEVCYPARFGLPAGASPPSFA